MPITDFSFSINEFKRAKKLNNKESIIYGIRNILLSRPGNYPLMPNFGMNISKYNLHMANEETLSNIREELSENIREYIPNLNNVNVEVKIYDNPEDLTDKTKYLGISVSGAAYSDTFNTNFLIYENSQNETIILNESF